jgi:hypothetical protein
MDLDLSLSEAREYEHCARNERSFLARLRACIANEEPVLPAQSAHQAVKEKRDDKRQVPEGQWSRVGLRAQLLASWARAVVATEKALRAWANADNAQRAAEKAEPPSPVCHDAAPEGRPLAPDGLQPTGASELSRHPDLNRGPTVYELAGSEGAACDLLYGHDYDPDAWSTGRPR